MNRRNIAIIGVAAVVIAACLLVGWMTLGDDDSEPLELREFAVGDSAAYERTVVFDGEAATFTWTTTVISMDDDGYLLKDSSEYWDNFYESPITNDADGAERVALETPMGTIECYHIVYAEDSERYQQGYREMWRTASGQLPLRYTMEKDGWTSEAFMTSTTVAGDLPEFVTNTVSPAPEAGDGILYYRETYRVHDNGYQLAETEGITIGVASVEGGEVTYDVSLDGRTVTEPVDEFMGSIQVADAEGTGSYAIDTPYGMVLCQRVERESGAVIYVGIHDGIVYAVSMMRENGDIRVLRLMESSVIEGEVSEYAFPQDLWLGFTQTHELSYTDDDGTVVTWEYKGVMDQYYDGNYSTTQPPDTLTNSIMSTGFMSFSDFTYTGTEDLEVSGETVTCFHFVARDASGDGCREVWQYPQKDHLFKLVVSLGGTEYTCTITYSDQLGEPTEYTGGLEIRSDVSVGDYITYRYWYLDDDGYPTEGGFATITVTAVEDGNVTYEADHFFPRRTESVESFLAIFDGETGLTGDRILVDTSYGYILCELQSGEGELTQMVGVNDGIIYGVTGTIKGTDDVIRLRLYETSLAEPFTGA